MSKVVDVRSGGGEYVILGKALVLPASSTDGTDLPLNGSLRFNPNTNTVEIYANQVWSGLGGETAAAVLTKLATASGGGTTNFLRADGTFASPTAPTAPSFQTTTAYTPVAADADTYIEVTNASAITFTVPANATTAFAIGATITVEQGGAGAVTLAPAVGVILQVASTHTLVTNGQRAVVQLKKKATNTWIVFGNLVAA